MSVWTRDRDGVCILELRGDFAVGRSPLIKPLDLQGRPLDDLGEAIRQLHGRGHSRILLNLEQVGFIDSAGLGELIACKKRTIERGGDIKLLKPRGQVKQVLVATLLTEVFDIFDDEDRALRAFRPKG